MTPTALKDTGYASWYAGQVLAALQRRTGPLSTTERDQLYGALYAAAATHTGALLDPADANAGALADMIRSSRNGPCLRCSRPLAEHDLDLASAPWLACPAPRPTAESTADPRSTIAAWAMWVAVPLLSLGLLSWLPSLVAAIRHRGRGWGIATALLALFTLSFWTQADVDVEAQLALWLGASIYGATQVKPWLRVRGPRGR